MRSLEVAQQNDNEDDSAQETPLPHEPVDETLEITKGATLSSVLEKAGISAEQSNAVIDSLKVVFDPRDLRPDHDVYITYKVNPTDVTEKDLLALYIKVAIDLDISVKKISGGTYIASKVAKELIHENRAIEGTIEESLYGDALKNGANTQVLHEMIAAFSYDVDFQRSFQPGDTYGLYYDTYQEPESLQEKPGSLLFAYLNLSGRLVKIYRYQPKNGVAQYFNEHGEHVKKGLMRTPIDGARLSSGFGRRRHPVLGYTKLHKGVDFAAPVGTPIMAAGDGRIGRIGPFSTYGNYIRIDHSGNFSTAYAHLSRFAKGLRAGSAVRQGQIIGYVGRTGRVTGAHLHYEVIRGGVHINPSSIKMLPAGKLKGKDLAGFLAFKAKVEKDFQARKNQVTAEASDASPTGGQAEP
jgi:murein DD-endopeptidase MepM/ murein hydrolase activator NlpD